jgi:hypothetical protein
MNDFLKTSPTKNKIIRQITSAFISLVNVDLDTFTINKEYSFRNQTKENILERKQQLSKDTLYSKGGYKKTQRRKTRSKKYNKTIKKIKIINRKRNKTRIKRKNTIPNNRHDLIK